MAQSGHLDHACTCPLLGVKRTWLPHREMSASDPKRTWRSQIAAQTPFLYANLTRPQPRGGNETARVHQTTWHSSNVAGFGTGPAVDTGNRIPQREISCLWRAHGSGVSPRLARVGVR